MNTNRFRLEYATSELLKPDAGEFGASAPNLMTLGGLLHASRKWVQRMQRGRGTRRVRARRSQP